MELSLTERRAIEFSPSQLAEIVTKCFEGYVVPFVLDALAFENRFRSEGLDTPASVILMADDKPAGVCLMARQGWTSRVAAMAIAPDFRSKGVGKHLLNKVIEEAKHRGDKRMVLEVIEQNPPAIGLYESAGFAKTRRLVGYRKSPSKGKSADLLEIDPAEVVRRMVAECDTNLPWDFKPETLSTKPNMVGLTLAHRSFALLTDTPGERVILWSIFTRQGLSGKGLGRSLIEALAARFPNKSLVTPVAVPDDLCPEFFEHLGFTSPDVSQFEMELELYAQIDSE